MKWRKWNTAWALLAVCCGFSLPVQAQIDLTGTWAGRLHEDYQTRLTGPEFVDYAGIPLNKDGLASALSYTTATFAELDRSCAPYPAHYLLLGPWGIRISPIMDEKSGQVSAWRVSGAMDREAMTIWVDGREAPGPEALHTFAGYSVGHWQGNTLVVVTTHLKDSYLTRNGVPSSSREKATFYFSRHDQDLTITAVIEDPTYLTAPYVMSRTWVIENAQPVGAPVNYCTPEEELSNISPDTVAHFLPGKNTSAAIMTEHYHLPKSATHGGVATMFPEFVQQLKADRYTPAGQCTRYCCGDSTDTEYVVQTLMCKTGP